tara:strand:- start:13 stop:225 length:213 start_codon:yes stop_codon:yes gene_type:complete
MKHWKTKEEMGEGFQHNEKDHKKFEYNSMENPKIEDKNTMRTKYLIRDIWTNTQLLDLKKHIDQVIEEKG